MDRPAAAREPASPPDLYRKLVLLTGVRLLVGTALLVATWVLGAGDGEAFPKRVEAYLYGIVAATYAASLVTVFFLRLRRFLRGVAYVHVAADLLAASALIYLTGGPESLFTILYPLAIVNAAVGLGRRGAVVAALGSAIGFCILALGFQSGFLLPPTTSLLRPPLPAGRLALTLLANICGFLVAGMLATVLAEQVQGARVQLADRETRLEALEASFSAVVRSIGSGIVTTDEQGRITYLNPAAEEITGLSDSAAHGLPLRETLPGLALALDGPAPAGPQRNETMLRSADGREHIVGWAIAPLAAHGGSGHVMVFQDLTEFRRMEEAMRRADRLAVVGSLAAGLAHEIRNPLAAMCGSIDLLCASAALGRNERRLMQVVRGEGERLEGLVKDFLAFAKPASPHLEIVDAVPLVKETTDVFRREAVLKGIALTVQLDPSVPVLIDANQIKSLLWNLLGNAHDATDAGGRIAVRLRRLDEQAILEVEDSGQGIATEDLPRIFDPFFTTKSGGTGLGLAIVHRIIEGHGGRIAVRSEAGRGSTFVATLPLAAGNKPVGAARTG
jgi:two-component system, NtrC family, sensor histidine kinase PilS